jgi:Myb/SANT-like DNA-binding domain
MAEKKRSVNFTKEESFRLMDLVSKYAHILENKKTDAVTWQEKVRNLNFEEYLFL